MKNHQAVPTFVPQHKSSSQQSALTALLSLHTRIEPFHPIDEQECQQYDILAHLRRLEDGRYPLLKASRRKGVGGEGW